MDYTVVHHWHNVEEIYSKQMMLMAPVIHTHANRCSLSIVFPIVTRGTFGNQVIALYGIIALPILMYNHRNIFGLQPHVLAVRFRLIIKALVALFVVNSICLLHRRFFCLVLFLDI